LKEREGKNKKILATEEEEEKTNEKEGYFVTSKLYHSKGKTKKVLLNKRKG